MRNATAQSDGMQGDASDAVQISNGWRVLFTRTSDLIQRLQIARRELALERAIAKLNKYHVLILDDIAFVRKDQAERSCCSSSLEVATNGVRC